MKQCLECKRIYGDGTLNFCLEDGSRLVMTEGGEESATVMMPISSDSFGSYRTAPVQQDIHFCETSDGVQIAYSVIGSGPLLVRVLGPLYPS